MNDKLKELAGRANFGHVENDEVVFDKRLDVFAKLIIQECLDIAEQTRYDGGVVSSRIKFAFGYDNES